MKQELLAPAGDIACAKAALAAGADAIYLGLPAFSARAGAGNFALSEFSEIVRLAHLLGAKVYVCLNTLVKDGETDAFFESALAAWNLGADALLIQDIFLGKELKRRYPSMILHLSTQAGCCNVYGAELAKEYGFSRVVLARETPLGDIAAISSVIETEVFVQGALCSCFSGQCYFSSFAGNNSGNRGRCKQPCRKLYSIDRAGFEERAYALSLSDLSVGERVKELLQAGVTSLKIEGRMRREEYVSAAVGYYRAILDGAEKSERLAARSALARAFDRGDYTEGLAFGQENLLSRNVQGHIGERVGVLEVKGGRYFCRGSARKGDGFKILRGGKEAGGAVPLPPAARRAASALRALGTAMRWGTVVFAGLLALCVAAGVVLVVLSLVCEGSDGCIVAVNPRGIAVAMMTLSGVIAAFYALCLFLRLLLREVLRGGVRRK